MSKLDIGVTLQAKGNTLRDGVWLSYHPLNTSDAAAKGYLKDAAGNIEIPGGGVDEVQIAFQLQTRQLTLDRVQYKASFQLANNAHARETLAIRQGVALPPSGIFEDPRLDSDDLGGAAGKVSTVSKKRDDKTYSYTLKVGLADQQGRIVNVEHDPKIKNGGTASRWGVGNPLTAVALVTFGAVLALVFPHLVKLALQLFR